MRKWGGRSLYALIIYRRVQRRDKIMAFRKKVDFVQMERDELPQLRPVIIFITAPVHSKDFTMKTSLYKQFKTDSTLPAGVLKKDANPYNLCLIEAEQNLEKFDEQLKTAIGQYREAAHKVVVINGRASTEGVFLKDEGGDGNEKLFLTGRHFAELISPFTHKHHLHVFTCTAMGHCFSKDFYTYISQNTEKEIHLLVAISFFTTEKSPNAWVQVSTSGNGNVEVTRDITDFVRSHILPNTPYKILDSSVGKSSCVIL